MNASEPLNEADTMANTVANILRTIAERLDSRMQWLQTEEQKAKVQYKVLRVERLRQEGALDCFKLIAKELGDK